jgi:hypothetical protein
MWQEAPLSINRVVLVTDLAMHAINEKSSSKQEENSFISVEAAN